MRVGVLVRGTVDELDWARSLGFRSVEWIRFEESPAAPPNSDWKSFAGQIADAAKTRDIRISAIGALYGNPLHPPQTKHAKAVFKRAIDVAAFIGIKTVAGFAGGVIETEVNPRTGQVFQKPFSNFISQLLAFWEPLAYYAGERGVRLAFENCPQGPYHLPIAHYNMMGQTAVWEEVFEKTRCANIGLEWDPSHLICQFIDPVANLKKFGSRVFHVHAKDAWVDRQKLELYGPCHPGVTEHRFPGLGQADWAQIIHTLVRSGYDSDLNIEGWHDPVFRDHPADSQGPLAGKRLESAGLLIAKRTLEALAPPD